MGLTAAQLKDRQSMIAATDMVVLAGVYPVFEMRDGEQVSKKGPADIYRAKCGEIEEEEPTFAMKRGNVMEPLLLDEAKRRLNLTLSPGYTMRHPEHSWIGGTPDALVVNNNGETIAVVEAKDVGSFRVGHWGHDLDAVPDYVRVQVQWQMIVAGVKHAYVPMAFGPEPTIYEVAYDDDLARTLLAVGEDFWRNHVVPRKPPPADGSKGYTRLIQELYPRVLRPQLIEATPEVELYAKGYSDAVAGIKALEIEKEFNQQKLREFCGANEGIQGNGWRLKLSERAECLVDAKPYVRKAYRHFDLRMQTNKSAKAA